MIFNSFIKPVTKRHVEQKILNTHPLHLFRIIQDVDQYSRFLPLCSHSKILRYTCPDKTKFDATLTVGLPPLFTETYTSAVTIDPKRLIVESNSISGQKNHFDSLSSRWQLFPYDDNNQQTKVDFIVEMTVSDPIIISTLDRVLEQVAGHQVNAFAKRCKQIPMILTDDNDELQQRQ